MMIRVDAHPRYATQMDEVTDRLRRVETRLTSFLEAEGVTRPQTRKLKFVWVNNRQTLLVPSTGVSLHDMLSAVDIHEEVPILLDGKTLAYIRRIG
jgi:hypothetical protein